MAALKVIFCIFFYFNNFNEGNIKIIYWIMNATGSCKV